MARGVAHLLGHAFARALRRVFLFVPPKYCRTLEAQLSSRMLKRFWTAARLAAGA